GRISDSSLTTYVMAYWVRDRDVLSLADGVRRLTSDPAHLFGQVERGVLKAGMFADINVIDLPALEIMVPEYRRNLPGGAGMWVQEARGYDLTLVNGKVFMEGGTYTGQVAGRLLT